MGKQSMIRSLATLGTLTVAAFVGLQFWPNTVRSNPAVAKGRAVEERLRIPPDVSKLLNRSCGNCHSNRTEWPWYSRVAPFSWQVTKDVAEARSVMNFSDWQAGPGSNATLEMSWLTLMCSTVQARRMPPGRYLLLHPDARLNPGEVEAVCRWTRAESARLSQRVLQALDAASRGRHTAAARTLREALAMTGIMTCDIGTGIPFVIRNSAFNISP